jgi:hypothetical protein
MDLPKLAEMAYERYATTLASEGRIVPSWSKLVWKDQEAWLNAIQFVINADLWETV